MRLFNLGRVKQAAGRLSSMFGPRAAILMYHRVTESVSDPCMLRVTPQHFEEHLQVIRQVGRPVRLEELAHRVRDGNMPEHAVCVTFDDGYDDNLHIAKPLLERYDVPATVFMTTGTIGRSREFWWDELERVFLQPGCLPVRLQLAVNGQRFEWELGESSHYSENDLHQNKAWTMPDPDGPNAPSDPTPRHTAFRALDQLLQSMAEADRQQVLDRLLDWSGVRPTVRPTHRALDLEKVVELGRGGIVEVGAHTVNHLELPAQPAEVQREEIRQSKSALEQRLGHPVKSFAYPYGFYSEESVTAVREAGFEYACACLSRTVRRNSDLFLLPRVDVLNWDGDAFARRLRKHLGV
ncbi:MAG: polysaccharide deacetylase family protein [Acidiferrobacterales bacterium]